MSRGVIATVVSFPVQTTEGKHIKLLWELLIGKTPLCMISHCTTGLGVLQEKVLPFSGSTFDLQEFFRIAGFGSNKCGRRQIPVECGMGSIGIRIQEKDADTEGQGAQKIPTDKG